MVKAVPDILARIVEHKRRELADVSVPRGEVERWAAERVPDRRDFKAALLGRGRAVIAEIKKASPSRGVLAADFRPVDTARAYEAGGAACLSVLTDREFFQGSLEDLERARLAVSLPVLRKDFTIDEFHVIEAAAAGADAILLIAAILSERELRDLRELAGQYEIAALVEVHAEHELSAAIDSGADMIGVNNRDLHTFQVALDTSLRLAERMPDGIVRVTESGIETAAQIATLERAGYHGFLVGEHLMRAGDPCAALKALLV
ncbi:MAG TPA: indole-3-glycerol phosphate synthase TrpC [Bryobacteraceae bacterium]|nr:indole-3-glycerol phosphate synthase TrpC [Bryobacteraceae bacterium]